MMRAPPARGALFAVVAVVIDARRVELQHQDLFERGDEFFAWMLEQLATIGGLTRTETRVCEHLMLGRRYADVAAMEGISIETVRWHAKRILRKIDVESAREFTLAVGRSIDENRQA